MADIVVYCHLCDYRPHSTRDILQIWYWDRIEYHCHVSGKHSIHALRSPIETVGGEVTPVHG